VAWLKAELALWTRQLENGPAEVRRILQHWQRDPDLAGLRAEAALAKLPPAEREAGRQLWAEVDSLLQKAREQALSQEEEKPMPRADR
jgi:hypothetical protein